MLRKRNLAAPDLQWPLTKIVVVFSHLGDELIKAKLGRPYCYFCIEQTEALSHMGLGSMVFS